MTQIEKPRKITAAAYAAGIPKCCSYETLEAHKSMMLCWGLVAALEAGEPMDCSGCDLKKQDEDVPNDTN